MIRPEQREKCTGGCCKIYGAAGGALSNADNNGRHRCEDKQRCKHGMHRGQIFTFAWEGDEEEGKPMYINHWVERKVDKGREEIREEKQDRGGSRERAPMLEIFISTSLIVISIN